MNGLEPWHLLLAVLGALSTSAVTLFIGGKWVGRIETIGKTLEGAMQKWEHDREKLTVLDQHALRIEQMEENQRSALKRLEEVWRKVFSHDKHIAVLRTQSSHDLGDSDPPDKE